MKWIAIALLAVLAVVGGLCLVGCETESATENNVRITPAAAVIEVDQSIELVASGGFEYDWTLSNEEWGTLSTRKGNRTVYTSNYDPGADTYIANQTVTVTSTLGNAGADSNLLDYAQIAEAVITHQTVQAMVTVTPPYATVGNYGSATFTASGANTYSWSMQQPTLGHLTAVAGPTTTYTSTFETDEEILQILTCNTDRGSVSVHVVHDPDASSVSIAPSSATVAEFESVTFTASGATYYEWSLANPTWGTLSTTDGPTTTYTSTYDPPAEDIQTLTCQTDEGTVSVSIIHEAEGVILNPNSVSLNEGESVQFTATGGSTYSWSKSGSGSELTLFSALSGSQTTLNFPDGSSFSGSRTFTVTVTSGADTDQSSVTIHGTL